MSAFFVGDEVYLVLSDGSLSGPFLISSVLSSGVYTICHLNGDPANDGNQVDEENIRSAS
jgi:hypothetical protein